MKIKSKLKAALPRFRARLHAQFHHALANGLSIVKRRLMAYAINQAASLPFLLRPG